MFSEEPVLSSSTTNPILSTGSRGVIINSGLESTILVSPRGIYTFIPSRTLPMSDAGCPVTSNGSGDKAYSIATQEPRIPTIPLSSNSSPKVKEIAGKVDLRVFYKDDYSNGTSSGSNN